ncbi:MAG: leucyl aminopeptidase [Gemmatimonadota bacterium]
MRRVEVRSGDPRALGVALLAIPIGPDGELGEMGRQVDVWLGGALARWLAAGRLTGEEEEGRLFPSGAPEGPHVLAIGGGDPSISDAERARRIAARAIREARENGLRSVALTLAGEASGAGASEVQACAEGFVLGDWSYNALKSPDAAAPATPAPDLAVIHVPQATPGIGEAAERGRVLAEAQNFARDLVTLPGNVATPSYLAACAEEMAERHGLHVEAWGTERLQSEGFGALLAVARGSEEEPRFLIIEYAGAEDRPVVLVGKGVTFDSGGISLKPAKGMEAMKYDMAGAAAVLGALRAAAELGLSRRIVGLVPATENLPSGSALKPADVIRGLSGRSIEVVSTDAEGRLILSDALSYATRLNPTAVVDVATLTGACVVALGRHGIALMSNDDALAGALETAGARSGERVWRLPLWREYRKQLDSEIADLKNSGGREAGTITAGWFLREFVGEMPWAHLDIAGTAWAEEPRPWQPKGATGVGVRLLAGWLDAAD